MPATLTLEERLALADTDPELVEILKNSPPVKGLDASTDVPALRANLAAVKKAHTEANTEAGDKPYVEEDRQIPVRDGSSIPVRIHRPKEPPKDGSPVFVVYHGGGFCLGNADNEAVLCRQWTALGGVAVNVDYRLAPEHPFPTPINDAYDALKWTAAHIAEIGGNPKKGFLIGGISAGANFAAVLSHLYRDDKISPPLTGVYLSIPPVCAKAALPEKYKGALVSLDQNKDAPVLNNDSIALFEKLYNADSLSPLKSPFIFPSHKDLPPTYFQICGKDPLRDEGLLYEQVLREDYGIPTRTDLYPGLPHGFWAWWPQANFTKKFQGDCVKGLEWLLEQSK